MSIYLDANVLVALLIPDPLTARATAMVSKLTDPIIVSDFAALEFASTVARKVRDRILSGADGRQALVNFDTWSRAAARAEALPSDIVAADAIVRRFDINLHGMDAVHVAIVIRLGVSLLTLDAKMKANARKLGVTVI